MLNVKYYFLHGTYQKRPRQYDRKNPVDCQLRETINGWRQKITNRNHVCATNYDDAFRQPMEGSQHTPVTLSTTSQPQATPLSTQQSPWLHCDETTWHQPLNHPSLVSKKTTEQSNSELTIEKRSKEEKKMIERSKKEGS